MWRTQPVSSSQFPCLYSRVTCWFMKEKLSSAVQCMAHFMGHKSRGRWRWRGLTLHANQMATDCGNTSSLKQVELHCTRDIYFGRCVVVVCQPWLFCCMEIITKPDLQIGKPLRTPSISNRNLLSFHNKINSRPFKNVSIITEARLFHESTI